MSSVTASSFHLSDAGDVVGGLDALNALLDDVVAVGIVAALANGLIHRQLCNHLLLSLQGEHLQNKRAGDW